MLTSLAFRDVISRPFSSCAAVICVAVVVVSISGGRGPSVCVWGVLFFGLLCLPRRCDGVDGVLSFCGFYIERLFEPLGVVLILVLCVIS